MVVLVHMKSFPCAHKWLISLLVNGERHYVNCRNHSRDEVIMWVNLLRTQSGNQIIRMRKMWHTDCPSIQGPWSPFVNRDPQLNLVEFPNVSCVLPWTLVIDQILNMSLGEEFYWECNTARAVESQLAWPLLWPWIWKWRVPPEQQLDFNGIHSIVSQKIDLFITTAMRTWNPT
jgi:hypothetical protein